MNRRVITPILFVFSFAFSTLHAQNYSIDTLKPNYGILGSSDTLHRFFQSSSGIFPILDGLFPALTNPFLRYLPMGSFIHPSLGKPITPKYISLPFVGFAYAFGSHGSQHMNLAYHQTFRGGWMLNTSFLSHAGGGMIRNNFWQNRNLNSGLFHEGKRNTLKLNFQAMSDNRPFSLGLQQPLLANDFSIDLLPIRKDSCRSEWREKTLTLSNTLRFAKDSLSPFRLFQKSSLGSKTRKFNEYDTLAGWYSTIKYDSLRTYDRYELVDMKHNIGLSYDKGPLKFIAGPTFRYWRARFDGLQSDTSELGINFGFSWDNHVVKMEGSYDKNVIGAYGEQIAHFAINKDIDSLMKWKGSVDFGQVSPDVFQRWYTGNTVSYHLNNPSKQTYFSVNLSLQGQRNKLKYRVYLQGLQTLGVYQFNGISWSNQEISSNSTLAGLGGEFTFQYKGFSIRPGILGLWDTEQKFPLTKMDLLVNKTFTFKKPKNLQLFTTMDLSYLSGFTPIGINPVVSAFDYSATSVKSKGYMSMVALVGFKVQTFRFFISGTNLGYFIQNNAKELFQNYPIPPWQLKVGITWDFWN